jgi:hypothetical protein
VVNGPRRDSRATAGHSDIVRLKANAPFDLCRGMHWLSSTKETCWRISSGAQYERYSSAPDADRLAGAEVIKSA